MPLSCSKLVCWTAIASVLTLGVGGCGSAADAGLANDDVAVVVPKAQSMQLGTNLDGLAYWAPSFPVLDAMKSSGEWLPQTETEWNTGEVIPLDENGWPMLNGREPAHRYQSLLAILFHDNKEAPSAERYVVYYDGEGDIEVSQLGGGYEISRKPGELLVVSGTEGSLYLRLKANPSKASDNYIRNIRVVRESQLPFYDAGLTFNPVYLNRIKDFHVIRFMDWMNTNLLFGPTGAPVKEQAEIANVPQIAWKDRPLLSDMRWGDVSRGMPVEALVEFANRTGSAPWFNMPINASDEYIREFARYVRDNLRPDLKLRVEFSNEVWNTIFPQTQYAEIQAKALYGSDAHGLEWYGMRAAQVGMIWKDVFGESIKKTGKPKRVTMVFGTQFAWKGLEEIALNTKNWRDENGKHVRAADYFDEYAVACYYDGTMSTEETVASTKAWWKEPHGGYSKATDALAKRITEFNTPLYQYHAEKAKEYGMALVSYEGGFGETTPMSQHENDAYTQFIVNVQRRPELKKLETANFRAFADAGAHLYMNFGIITLAGKWGSWGALEALSQETSPRYEALKDWLQKYPRTSQQGRAATAFASKVMAAENAGSTNSGTTLTESGNGYDVLIGSRGNDIFVASTGTGSRMDGRGGTDTLKLQSQKSEYRFTQESGSAWVKVDGPEGTRMVKNITRVQFGESSPVVLQGLVSR